MLEGTLKNIIEFKSSCVVFENQKFNFSIHHCIPKEGDYQLLITDGLRAYAQGVNEDNNGLEHIELYFCLPDYWNLDQNPWPLEWLNKLAEIPQKNTTWFGIGDTIPAGKPPEDLDDTFMANHFILRRPNMLAEQFSGEKWEKIPYKLLSVIPIFQRELDYKLRNSYSMLFKKFDKKNIDERIDPYRTSVCKKVVFGLF